MKTIQSNHPKSVFGHTSRRLCALIICALLLHSQLWAQPGAVKDGINKELVTRNNYVYYGTYKHALELTDDGQHYNVSDRETSATPVLWRVMGEETAGRSTLLSQYVIDSRIYGTPVQVWNSSAIHAWLNGSSDFPSNFTTNELLHVTTNTVLAPSYTVSTTTYTYNSNVSATNTRFYLPWGTPYATSTARHNSVFWVLSAGVTLPTIPNANLADKTAKLKKNPVAVPYWLLGYRAGLGTKVDYVTLVKSDGDVDISANNVSRGIRPIFQLDTSKILFASEMVASTDIERLDQVMAANDDYYRDGEVVSADTGDDGKVYKLTVSDGTAAIASLPYDYDEVLSANGLVAMKPGDTLRFDETTVSSANYDGTASKLVRDGSTPGTRETVRYGFKGNHSANRNIPEVIARNIATDLVYNSSLSTWVQNTDTASLTEDTYDAYIWQQKNETYHSNFGSQPLHFRLQVIDDNDAPALARISARRSPDGTSATVKFTITELNGGKYYYWLNPPSAPSDAPDFVNAGKPKNIFGAPAIGSSSQEFTLTLTSVFPDNSTTHNLYIVAKDSVRNESSVLHIVIPIFVPNTPPTGLTPVLNLRPGEVKHVPLTDAATDPDVATGDVLKYVELITTLLNPTIATASLSLDSTQLIVTGVGVGDTELDVIVADLEPDSVTVHVPIHVKEPAPTATIDFVEETLTGLIPGGHYSFNGESPVQVGLSYPIAKAWLDSTITIERVNPASLPQLLAIPPRPVAPVIGVTNETFLDFEDGQLTGVNDSMVYRTDSTGAWTNMVIRNGKASELAVGSYWVRYRAVAGSRFASEAIKLTIQQGNPPPILTRSVLLPNVAGVTVTPAPGEHSVMNSSYSFTFSLQFFGPQLVVKTDRIIDGETEELIGIPNESGGYDYEVKRIITSLVKVSIGPDIVANDPVSRSSVWTYKGAVYVNALQAEEVSIYALSGMQVLRQRVAEGVTLIPLARGMYIVTLSDGTRQKVVVP